MTFALRATRSRHSADRPLTDASSARSAPSTTSTSRCGCSTCSTRWAVPRDFGTDFSGQSVGAQMAARWPVTITLALTAWAIEILLGIGLGVLSPSSAAPSSTRRSWSARSWSRRPRVRPRRGPAAGVLVRLHWFPVGRRHRGWPTAYLLPAFVVALFGLAAVSAADPDSMIETLDADFVRTARAKDWHRVVCRRARDAELAHPHGDLPRHRPRLPDGRTVIVEGIFNPPRRRQPALPGIRSHEGAGRRRHLDRPNPGVPRHERARRPAARRTRPARRTGAAA